jgi:GcrA cell cycle regulator
LHDPTFVGVTRLAFVEMQNDQVPQPIWIAAAVRRPRTTCVLAWLRASTGGDERCQRESFGCTAILPVASNGSGDRGLPRGPAALFRLLVLLLNEFDLILDLRLISRQRGQFVMICKRKIVSAPKHFKSRRDMTGPYRHVPLVKLGPFDCHWPTRREDDEHLFCGTDVVPGFCYCATHLRRAHREKVHDKRVVVSNL